VPAAAGGAGGYWRAHEGTDGILSGTLHGQSWAAALGLGLLAPAANISAHAAAERTQNCAYEPVNCSLGPLSFPAGAATGATWARDASPAQAMDATAAALIAAAAGGGGGGGLPGTLAEAVVELYAGQLADAWDVKDLHVGPDGLACAGADVSGAAAVGQPFVNAHYARQLQGWAVILAATGQQWDAPARSLALTPLCEPRDWRRGGGGGSVEVVLPVITPAAIAHVVITLPAAALGAEVPRAELRVLSGALRGDVAATLDLARCTGPRGALLRGVFRAAAERPDVPAGGVAEMRAI
jgi:hypothetical protein